MYRTLFGILAVFAAALALVAVTFSSTREPPADLVFVNGAEPRSLDPARVTGQPEGRLADALFEGLARIDGATGRPVPGAAASWEVSPDGLRWTFHLRPGLTWSDGRPLGARDFAWSWRRLLDPRTASEYAYLLYPVVGAEALHAYEGNARALLGPLPGRAPAVEAIDALLAGSPGGVPAERWQALVRDGRLHEALRGVEDPDLVEALGWRAGVLAPERVRAALDAARAEGGRRAALAAAARERFGVDQGAYAVDDRTLVVELRALTPYFPEIVAFHPTFPVPRHVVEVPGNAEDWFLPAKMVSNGPFCLAAWRVDEKIRLRRSDTYWGRDEVGLAVVDALPIANRATCLNLFLTGGADWLSGSYPPDLVGDLRERSDFYASDGLGTYFYRFNCSRPPFDDPRLRQAVCLAVDRGPIVEHVVRLGNRPATTFVPPLLPGYESPPSAVAFDPPRARALLAEAGHPDGRGLPRIGILYNTDDVHAKIAENVAWQLRRNLGLDVRAYNQEWPTWSRTVRALDYDLARASWIADYADPGTFLEVFTTGGGNNRTGWSDPAYDRLLSLAADVSRAVLRADAWLPGLREGPRARALVEAARGAPPGPARVEALGRVRLHLLREAEAILLQDAFPVMPLYFYVWSGLVRSRVQGLHATLAPETPGGPPRPNLRDLHPLRDLRVLYRGERR